MIACSQVRPEGVTLMRTQELAAIDVHVHVEIDDHGHLSLDDELMDASARYFRADHDRTPPLERIAELYRSLTMAAVVFTVDAGTASGHPAISSEEVAANAARYPDVLIPFGSACPRWSTAARPGSGRACRAAAASSSACLTRCWSTTWRPISPG
jgi:predicted TIM-barrel fold metal-dependent hydrolase